MTEATALVAITRGGALLLQRLAVVLPEADLYVNERGYALLQPFHDRTTLVQGGVAAAVGDLFSGYDQLVFTFSIGASLRLLAPHLQDKSADPGVVVVDEAGRFVIPVLSGHLGGANRFAAQLAEKLGATAVFTTAAEVQQTLAVDILGRELGWQVEADKAALLSAAAAVVNGEPVALVQEAGSGAWWPADRPLPNNIHLFENLDDLNKQAYAAILYIGHVTFNTDFMRQFGSRLVCYRPPLSSEGD
ncbi:MAG: cobalamin biosynthesis protein CbiG [Gammaproteobacteria bacterium]|nr:cobalamin biosynthesis protein CbiG [Gammaproteobacteria bacterium]